ncbi:MAG TPA: GlsB/YeaQ/YmgE family stress response membrane protein [Actinomycetota bacterium]|nr:GlsB/YeaQ/YmgE family stress response membrane protein [Actinomycetota bacterium]
MEWIVTIIVGLIIGAVARFLMPGKDPIGIVGTLVIGVLGALIGTWLWEQVLFKNSDNEGVSWIGGIIVAMILLFIYRQMTYRRGAVR